MINQQPTPPPLEVTRPHHAPENVTAMVLTVAASASFSFAIDFLVEGALLVAAVTAGLTAWAIVSGTHVLSLAAAWLLGGHGLIVAIKLDWPDPAFAAVAGLMILHWQLVRLGYSRRRLGVVSEDAVTNTFVVFAPVMAAAIAVAFLASANPPETTRSWLFVPAAFAAGSIALIIALVALPQRSRPEDGKRWTPGSRIAPPDR